MINARHDFAAKGPVFQRRSGWLVYVLIIVTCSGLLGCSNASSAGMAPPPPAVMVSLPLKRSVIDYADFTGRTMAVESVRVRARVWGHLEKINFTEGADVKKGDVLFVIDRRPYEAALARANAEVEQSQARCRRLNGDQKRAVALSRSNAISQEDVEKIAGDLSEATAMVQSSISIREVAKLNLEFTEVKAPISGQISRAMVTVGNMVESGETGGTVLTTLMSTDTMYAYFDVDDQTWVQVRQLLRKSATFTPTVQLGLSNEKGHPHQGKLDFIDNQVDASTGTLRMRGLFPNQDRLLTPGLFVRIRLPLGASHDALLVSDRAIDTDQGQKIIYVVNRDHVVEKRLVKLGGLHDGLREIESGVNADEQVIVEGIQRVRTGVTVSPQVAALPGAK
jgi:multidrug efflux system membrane fusion protein